MTCHTRYFWPLIVAACLLIVTCRLGNARKRGNSVSSRQAIGPEYLHDLYPACGNYSWPSARRRSGVKSRLAGGSHAQLKQFPSYVRLEIRPLADPERVIVCGGVILDKDRILTAAHCVEKWENSSVEIFAGLNSDIFNSKENLQIRHPKTICLHPNYKVRASSNQEPGENDIAVLKLKTNLQFSDYVQPACVTFQRRPYARVTPQDTIYAVGFGDSDRGRFSHKLLYVKMSLAMCQNEHFPETNSCVAPGESGGGFCVGDAGGGLYVMHDNKQFLVGIATGSKQTDDVAASSVGYCKKGSHVESYFVDIHKIWKESTELCA